MLKAPRTVRVLIQSTRGAASFPGASAAAGRKLSPAKTYSVRGRAGGQVQLVTRRGKPIVTAPAPLRVTGPGPITVLGASGYLRNDGSYRGALEFRPGSLGGVNVINALDVDDYVRGVIPLEVSATWPAEALKAQAVAARTYALTTNKDGDGFDHYANTSSQVYGGVAAEQATSNAAAAATKGQLVTYQGEPVATYFFSTSGGRTEDVEKSGLGTEPLPWLRSVEDKYDSVSPRHRWGPIRLSMASAGAKLRGLYRGRFRGVKVLTRGSSPRIVAADVVGTAGRSRVNGADAARPARAVRQLGVLHLDQHRQGAAAAAGEDAGAGRRARARHRGPQRPRVPGPRGRGGQGPAPARRPLGHGRHRGDPPRRPLPRGRARRRALPDRLPRRRRPGRPRRLAGRVDPRERLGDADRLVAALALERHLDGHLRAAGDVLQVLELRVHADAAADRQRRREADAVEPVVDREGEALERERSAP